MIAYMDQLTLVGRRTIADDLLVSLQSLGVVQIDPLEPGEGIDLAKLQLKQADRELKEGWDAAVSKSATLIDAIGATDITPASRNDVPANLEGIQEYLNTVASQVDKLIAERGETKDELDVINLYLPLFRDFAPTLAQLEDSYYLTGSAFVVPAEKLADVREQFNEALDGRVILSTRERGKEILVVAAVLKSDADNLRAALGRTGLSALALPERYADQGVAKAVHIMEERSQSLPKRLSVLDGELKKLAEQHGAKLNAVAQIAQNYQNRYSRMEDLAEGRYSFALRGWVPSSERSKVVEGLKKQFGDDVIIETRPADDHHDHSVPVKLENPSWVKPFEGLLSLFAPPKYGNFDPSWTLAVFFPLFFGVVVGDIGFGLLFLVLGIWMRARGKNGKSLSLGPIGITLSAGALPSIGTVINWCAMWSILFGVIYGEFFGNFLEHWPHDNPVFYITGHGHHGMIPILIPRAYEYTPVLILSLGFGVFQVLFGWGLRVYYGMKHNDKKHIWEGIGMLGGLIAMVIFATAFLLEALNPLVWVVVAAGFAVFFAGVIMSGVPLMLVEIISNSGNILSYLRLFAVGLSAALVANLATDLGFAIGGVAPVIGPLLGIIVGLAVHLIAITLTIIGHTLQPLRLQYVEFFTKFGFYEESGRPYQPFRLFGGKA